jgi:hypothetical protein
VKVLLLLLLICLLQMQMLLICLQRGGKCRQSWYLTCK